MQVGPCEYDRILCSQLTRSMMPPVMRHVSLSWVATTSMPLLLSISAPQAVPSAGNDRGVGGGSGATVGWVSGSGGWGGGWGCVDGDGDALLCEDLYCPGGALLLRWGACSVHSAPAP